MTLEETSSFLIDNGVQMEDISTVYEVEYPDREVTTFKIKQYTKPGKVPDAPHDGYPEVHPVRGRGRIGYHECFHTDCDFRSGCSDELRKHLKDHYCYTPYFHTAHEDMISSLNLTPEMVHEKKMTYCPSSICNNSVKDFKTSEALCEHLMLLGIEPFWQPGMQIEYESKAPEVVVKADKPIYASDECLVCFDKHPDVLILDCHHYICCFDCFNYTKRVCPLCRTKITKHIAY